MFSRITHLAPRTKMVLAAATTTAAAYVYTTQRPPQRQERVVIVGGGTAGIGVAAMLQRSGVSNVSIIEPSPVHYYQPLWTLVGGGVVHDSNVTEKPMQQMVPSNTKLIANKVVHFQPTEDKVVLEDGSEVEYDYLVVAAGLQIDWDAIEGLPEALQDENSGVVSIYDAKLANKTHRVFQDLLRPMKEDGTTFKCLFTMAPMPIKCAGAPQKVMWLFEDMIRTAGLRDQAKITFWAPGGSMFGVKHYSDKLEALRIERDIDAQFKHQLVKVDGAKKVAFFQNLDTQKTVAASYDVLHVTPPMSAPNFLKTSPLADAKGWVDVDKHTLQQTNYPNVFALGDCTNTPNSKTAAAITAQAPVLVHNMLQHMRQQTLDGYYNGYASCPLTVNRGRVILAEFGYGGKLMETFGPGGPYSWIGTDGALQQRFFYFLKERIFPFVYWNLWNRGLWYGTNGPIHPNVRKQPSDAPPQQ